MDIANPIYDVVFRYMMNDNRIAKLIISTIIDMEVESLEFNATEKSTFLPKESLTVYRLDFAATVLTPEGEHKKILIEIQKAKFPQDIMRFRRYLGEEYSSRENYIKKKTSRRTSITPIPLLTIYFLGYGLDHTKAPVIRVNRSYVDAVTGEKIVEKEDFIEGLTHDSYVIQIPYLKKNRQSKLLTLLSIFDQNNQTERDSGHILRINENDFSKEYREVIRRLQKAIAEPDVRNTMDMEDEIIEELKDKERVILRERAEKEKERAAKEKFQERFKVERAEKEAERAEKEAERAEKEAERAEKEAERAEKEVALGEIERLKKLLKEK